ncbi:MAG: cation transporter [Trueperaceae bacterium]|nr:cation transporter [Trueperaceae bacterium]MCO5173115.1 cation transporter [Trueperaceae bacterium]MCW5818483.1 cation transporter [Trueperaceae bacterium]
MNSAPHDVSRPGAGQHTAKSERTLLASWLLSAPGPVVTGIAVAMSSSATQIADAIRRTLELVALFTGWWTFRRRKRVASDAERLSLERRSETSVAVAMAISGVIMLLIGGYRFLNYAPGGNVIVGLIVAVLGGGVNATFWVRYTRLLHHSPDPVLAGQLKLYRAKTMVDLAVTTALLTVALIPTQPVTRYVDTLGSMFVACYLILQALSFRRAKAR